MLRFQRRRLVKIEEELACLKKRMRVLETLVMENQTDLKTSTVQPEKQTQPISSPARQDLLTRVQHVPEIKQLEILKILAQTVFTIDELKNSSISGKKSSKSKEGRVGLNVEKLNTLRNAYLEKCKKSNAAEFEEKLRNFQKVIRRVPTNEPNNNQAK